MPATATGLYLDGTDLRRMTSSDWDRTLYELRIYHASKLLLYHQGDANGLQYGAVQQGASSGFTFIGTAADRIQGQGTGTHTRGLNDGTDDAAIAAALNVSVTETTATSYPFYRNTTTPSTLLDTGSVVDELAPIQFDSDGSGEFEIQPTIYGANDLLLELIDECILQMHQGDEIGSYRFTNGTLIGGGWTEVNSNVFTDTRYDGTQIVYKQFLKTGKSDAATEPTLVKPMKFDVTGTFPNEDFNLIEYDPSNSSSGDLLQQYLHSHLAYRLGSPGLADWKFTNGSVPSGSRYSTRGTLYDYVMSSNDGGVVTFSNPTYTKTVTPSGGYLNRSTYRIYWDYVKG